MAVQGAENGVMNELMKRVNEDRRRIRLMEQNIKRVESALSSLEESAILKMGDIKVSLETISSKMNLANERLSVLENSVAKMGKSMEKTATKIELKQLEGFIDLVNPITSKFVTKDELERALDEKYAKKL